MTGNEITSGRRPGAARRLLSTQVLAGFAQWVDIFLIFSIPSFLWTSTPDQIAMVAACLGLPGLFLGPFAGVLVDRLDPRKMAFCGALLRSATGILLAFAPDFASFAVLVLLKGISNLGYWPPTVRLTQQIVEEPARIDYYSSLSALDQLTKIFTPLVAGFLVLGIDSQQVFLLSAVLTMVCALIIHSLPSTAPDDSQSARRAVSLLFELLSGLRAMRSLPGDLRASLAAGVAMSFILAVYDPHLAAFLKSVELGPAAFSMILCATAAGAVSGALLLRTVFRRPAAFVLIRLGILLFTLALASVVSMFWMFPTAVHPGWLMAVWFVSGMGYEFFLIGSSVNMQNLCPPPLLGRISTAARSFQMAAIVGAPTLGAFLIDACSRLAPFMASSAMAVLLLAALFLFRPKDRAG